MGMTMIEKILARASGAEKTTVGEIVFAAPYRVLSHDNSAAILGIFGKMGGKKVWDPSRVFIALDHAVPPPDAKKAENHSMIRKFVAEQGISNFYDCGVGICHQVLPEYGHVVPGVVIFGSDSHTTTHGALGAAGIPIGRTETASVWALGETWLRVPPTIKIVLEGKLPKGVYPKDVILHIIGQVSAEGATYKSVEFHGPAAREMSVGGRMTLCNMGAEMGAKAAMFPVDEVTRDWLSGIGAGRYEELGPDEDAVYEAVYTYDCSKIAPQAAKPHKVDNVVPVSELGDVKIDVALLGTCTNGRIEDLMEAAAVLEGKKIAPGVRLLVYPASRKVLEEAYDNGTAMTLLRAGAQIAVPACGPCLGAYGGILAPGETCVSTANRNFKGRMGCKEDTGIYLASPATVAASAIAGRIVSAG
ncbi:MAG TPA: 3-isopropylmalate dehydratase large subunit [Candidatus Eisenbacteria bacterium]|uniref:3-isopropylmalate dehydratase large subunit n=1 Tax=Eiseniibacteriota bacterium TaxID=2212470 RepID=A0A7V2ATH6_UNCEI|nr:3-isopropylmalate dehydratase large subunit [Candidatus Eisenbacteria bacterium]